MRRLIPIVLILFTLLVVAARHGVAAAQSPACTVVVNPGSRIQTAVSNAGPGAVICVRSGIYHETVTIRAKTDLTLMAHPDDSDRPIIDGRNSEGVYSLPTGEWSGLLAITNNSNTGAISNNIVVDGFEIRNSSGRGLVVSGGSTGVTLRNLSIHDSWGTGLLVTGTTAPPIEYVKNVVIENTDVYRNIRKAVGAPWVVRGMRTEGNAAADAWSFDSDQVWNDRYWSGFGTDLPSPSLAEISFYYDEDTAALQRVYVTVGNDKPRTIDAANSGTGQTIAFDALDILFQDQSTGKWTPYYDGSALGVSPAEAAVDAFEVMTPTVGLSETFQCPTCYPILMSFSRAVTLPGDVGLVGSGDIIEFTPTEIVTATGQIITGTYTLYRTAAELGIGTANVDSLAVLPDGRLAISTAAEVSVNGIAEIVPAHDLIVGDWGNWAHYFDASAAAENPYATGLTSASHDPAGNLLISGNPVGGSGFAFVAAQDSIARNNRIYRNHGEGLVIDRWSDRITAEDNVAWDNDHASLYLNGTTYPLVQRNYIYCTDDREYWEKANQLYYRAPPGFILRDEDFKGVNPPTSRGQIIINNTVVGCSTNFGVYAQPDAAGGPRGGLNGAIVAHNTFVNARGDGPPYFGLQFSSSAKYVNSTFANNVIMQPDPYTLATKVLSLSESAFTVSHNLYSGQPVDWYQTETGRIVADPQLTDPLLPVKDEPFVAAGYLPAAGSPAIDAALLLPGLLYAGGEQDPPDRGVDAQVTAAPRPGTIVIQLVNDPVQDTAFSFTSATLGNFTLRGASEPFKVFSDLVPGSYTVSQNLPAGWDFVQLVCSTEPDDTSVISGRTVTIDLDPNETVECSFINYQKRGTITVRAETDPDGAAASFTFDPSWSASNFSLRDGESTSAVSLLAGSYDVVPKNLPTGWSVIDADCGPGIDPTMPNGIELEPGGVVDCTFTFQLARGRIVLKQETTPITTTAFTYSPDWRIEPVSLAHGETFTSTALLPGSYAVTPAAATDWTLADASCDDDNSTGPGAIVLDPGEIVTCTFSHTYDLAGRVIVEKQTIPAGAAASFGFDPSWGAGFTLSDDQSVDSGLLLPGRYSVVESPQPAGWLATGVDCGGQAEDQIDLAPSQTITCVFTSTLGATLTIVQQTDPADDPTPFGYGLSWSATDLSLTAGQSETFETLLPGNYAITPDALPDGWAQTEASCDDGSDPAAIELEPGADVVCTFTNTLARGSITIVQETDPAADPTPFGYGLSWSMTDLSLTAGQSETFDALLPGNYAITPDALPDGWAQTEATCDDGSDPAAIELEPGADVVCTFTNTLARGSITIIQQTDPADDPTPFGYGLSWSATDLSLTDGQSETFETLLPGSYAITPDALLDGWAQTEATCNDGSDPSAIELSPGEDVVCTFTNSLARGSIVVKKVTVGADDATQFTFDPSWSATNFSLAAGGQKLSGPLLPGTYAVAEVSIPANWTLTGATCDDGSLVSAISLSAGETVTCTFTNQYEAPAAGTRIYVSALKSGSVVGGPSFAPQDVLTYDLPGANWGVALRGTSVGLTRNVNALAILPDGSYLLALRQNQNLSLGGVPTTVRPQDVIRYVPPAGGAAGRFEWYLQGSRVGLTTSGEIIDALALAPDGRLLVSTVGVASVSCAPGSAGCNSRSLLKAADEDLFVYSGTTGPQASGSWSLYFDGSTIRGMAVEDVVNASVDAESGTLYVSILGAFNIDGVRGNSATILAISRVGSAYQVSIYPDWPVPGYKGTVDAFEIQAP